MSGIAIIGMAGRFPGAPDLDRYWQNLVDGVETVAHLTPEELRDAGVPERESARDDYVAAGARMEGFDLFDAQFFGYTAREAEIMDPQHRVFLETCWEAVEHAGYDVDRLDGQVGVFGGASTSAYLTNVFGNLDSGAGIKDANVGLGNELGFLTTRVSYKLDLHGPSFPVQTACSSSLVAVHLARQNLLNYECDVAIAGAVAFKVPPGVGYTWQDGGITSPDGHCRPFDANAQGTLFGNGCGVVVLKRLDDAIADGDTVYAVIRGSAINNDGSVKASFSAPSVTGQTRVIADALADADVPADTIQYVEGHGSGTKIGDSIEIEALTAAYRQSTDRVGFATIGAVKSNIGHLDAASGIAGLIKTVLSLRNETRVPTVHFRTPSPEIDFAHSPFHVQADRQPWPRGGTTRRAAISAFGFGGTNAHVILDEAPDTASGPSPRPGELLVLSARTAEALERMTDRMADALRAAELPLADVAYTLARGRRVFPHRRIVLATDAESAARALDKRDPVVTATAQAPAVTPRVVLLCGGLGSQYAGMGAELYRDEPEFRGALDRCVKLFGSLVDGDLREAVVGTGETARQLLLRPEVAVPALFAMEYSTAALLAGWGVRPDAVVGSGVGELVAACVGGLVELGDACALVALRGRAEAAAGEVATRTICAPRATLAPLLSDDVWLAAVTANGECVVSGAPEAMDRLVARLAEQGVTSRPAARPYAAGGQLDGRDAEEVVAAFEPVDRPGPSAVVLSATSGRVLDPEQVRSPAYWQAQFAAPVVEFAAALRVAVEDTGSVLVDVSPGQVLTAAARRSSREAQVTMVAPALPRERDRGRGGETLRRCLGQLWLAGHRPDWSGYFGDQRRHRVGLPTYPFERHRFWLSPARATALPTPPATGGARYDDPAPLHPLLDEVVLDSNGQTVFGTRFSLERHWVLAEHRMLGEAIVPGTTYLEMARAAASRFLGRLATVVSDVEFYVPMLVREGEQRIAHTTVRALPDVADTVEFTVASHRPGPDGRGEWTLHVSGRVAGRGLTTPPRRDVAELLDRCTLATIGRETLGAPHVVMNFGPRWRETLRSVGVGDHLAVGRLRLPEPFLSDLEQHGLHPTLLDLATAFTSWAVLDENSDADEVRADRQFFLPLSYDRLEIYAPIPAETYSVITSDPSTRWSGSANHEVRRADVQVLALDGTPVLDVTGFTVKRVPSPRGTVSQLRRDAPFHALHWIPAPLPGQDDAVTEAPGEPPHRAVVVDLAGSAMAASLAAELRGRGAEVALAGPGREEDYRALLDQVVPDARTAVFVIAGDEAPTASRDSEVLESQLERGVHSLFALGRAIASRSDVPGELVLVASHVHTVDGRERAVAPAHAAMIGLVKVIGYENESLRCRSIDVDDATSARAVLAEALAPERPAVVAYRDGVPYRAQLVALTPDGGTADRATDILAPGSVFLVTGGLGGLGLQVARYLAETVPGVRIATVNRAPLPPREEWDGPLTEKQARAVAALRELVDAGAVVRCYAADVADIDQMRGVVGQVRDELGHITGVIHTAGVAGDGFMLLKEEQVFRGTLAPKIRGTVVLDEVTVDDPPAVMLLFGSTSALFGAAGQSDYTAANAFQDAFAEARSRAGRRTVAVDWTDWTEIGMAADHGVPHDRGFFRSITPEAALTALDTILRSDWLRVVVGEINYRVLGQSEAAAIHNLLQTSPLTVSAPIAQRIEAARQERQRVESAPVEPGEPQPLAAVELTGRAPGEYSATEQMVAAVWALELGLPEVNVFDSLFDLGGDSLIALRIAKSTQQRSGRAVKLADLFAHGTVAEFARFLDDAPPT